MASLKDRRGKFTATADPLDLDELLAIASGLSGPRPAAPAASTPAARPGAGAQPPLDVQVEIAAPRGRMVGIDFADLATTLALARGSVTLEPFAVGVFDGKLTGRLHLETAGATPEATLSAQVAGLDAERVAAFAGSTGVLTGRLAGQLTLEARGVTADAVFQSARGRATVSVTDGTLPGLDLVGPVILAFGKPDPTKPIESSRAFSRLGGTFTLANGLLQSDNLELDSRDVDLTGRGTLRVAGAVADVRANLTLSEALTAQAGRDLVRYAREGSRVVLPATVTGPLASPRVAIDVESAARRALRNELEDQVRKAFGRIRKP
jgi:AsmA protein